MHQGYVDVTYVFDSFFASYLKNGNLCVHCIEICLGISINLMIDLKLAKNDFAMAIK
jgi:hypothetical protein